jgi:hypothetical protein
MVGHEGTCDGCLKPATVLTGCGGDRLCARCKAVFVAAAALLDEGVLEEEVIIPTLVLAKMAGGSSDYAALARTGKPAAGLGIVNLMYKAEAEDYAGWELTNIIGDVPFVRILPKTANPRMHPSSQILHSVRIQVLSSRTKPSAVRGDYERVLTEQGARWALNIGGTFGYDFSHGYLGITVAAGPAYTPMQNEGIGEGPLGRPNLHFPPPVLVEDFYKAVLGSAQKLTKKGFAHALDLYGKPQRRAPENLVMAFAAWHIAGAEMAVPLKAKRRVAGVLNQQLSPTTPLSEVGSISSETLWRTVKQDAPRFLRLCTRGLANFQTGV